VSTRIDLPYPPSVNRYWRRVGNKTLISKEGRAYKARVTTIMQACNIEQMEGHLAVCVALYPPDRRRRDIDNTMKALLDAMGNGGAYEDDSQIKKLTIEMHDRDKEFPRAEVTIEQHETREG